MSGIFDVEYFDDRNRLIRKFKAHNNFTQEGGNFQLENMFCATEAASQWYVGIAALPFENHGGDLGEADTLANLLEFSPDNHSGWYEYPDASGLRQPYYPSVATLEDVRIHNTSVITFTLGSLGALYDNDGTPHMIEGVFFTNNPTYLGRDGVILTEAKFMNWFPAQVNYTLRLNYSIVM